MTEERNRSTSFLSRNSVGEQAEAAKSFQWNWSARALDLLTRYPRRGKEAHILTVDEVKAQNARLDEPFPEEMIMDFQRELGGVTYSTFGEDGEWATWGLTYIRGFESGDDEEEEAHVQPCCGYNTARGDGYALAADGKLWSEGSVALNARVEIERLAFELEIRREIDHSEGILIVVRTISMPRHLFHDACLKIFQSLGWSILPEAKDIYGCIWSAATGWAQYRPEIEVPDALFFCAYFWDADPATRCYRSLKQLLPGHELYARGMPGISTADVL